MEDNKDQKVDEHTQQAKKAAEFTNDILQTERLIDPGNEHHHDDSNEQDEASATSKSDAPANAKGNDAADNQPG